MKLKVYAILEKLNEQGVDFFEVWNAAAAMGKVEENTLKAAYTSLKFVDSSLSKDKLLATGTNYANKLKETIAKESEQKQAEKKRTEQDRTMEIANLNAEIKTITENIAKLQDDLQKKQLALGQVNEKYEPRIKDIEQKINIGNAAVDEVVTEINTALQMINQSIT
jgi:predicted  nucleic acid-binding Zn-ribbon protein